MLSDDLPTSFLHKIRREPLGPVITSKTNVILRGSSLFVHLRVWISHKIVRSYSFPTSQWYNNAFALRHRMLHFIQNLLYYITVEVLEPSWQTFVEKIRKVDNVDQVFI